MNECTAAHRRRRLGAWAVGAVGLAAAFGAGADGTGWFSPEQVAQGRWEYSQK